MFNWSFKNEVKSDAGDVDFVAFSFPDSKLSALTGGFRKVATPVRDGTRLYLYVRELEKTMEVCTARLIFLVLTCLLDCLLTLM